MISQGRLQIFVLLSTLVFPGCSSITYLFDAGIGQWKLLNRARPIEEVLANPEIDERTKNAILLVQDAKKFSVEELRLKATDNYNSYVKLDGAYASYVVTASHPLKLEPRLWRFPIVGEIPYIGFFEEKKAKALVEELKAERTGWYKIDGKELPPDVYLRGAPAYSTLGWLPDPLYSSMLEGSERRMVETVIHESVHATVFIGSNMDFNERLANFIGLEGSLLYMRKKYGEQHEKYIKAQAALASERIFARFIDAATTEFRNTVEPSLKNGVDTALARKKTFYEGLRALYEKTHSRLKGEFPKLDPPLWKHNFKDWNNAVLNGYRTYNADSGVFHELLGKCGGDVKRLVLWIVQDYDRNKRAYSPNPEAYIAALAKSGTCPP